MGRWATSAAAAALGLSMLVAAGCSSGDRAAGPPRSDPPRSDPPRSDPPRSDPPRSGATQPAASQAGLDAALIAAAWRGDVSAARNLIAQGADVNHQDASQQSAYLIATSEGFAELLELTLEHGADVSALDSYRGTGLIRAAERGHAAVVGRLLRAGIDANHVNNLGWTALHEAIVLGEGTERYVDTVRVLVAGGADLTLASRNDGVSPLDHAEQRGQRTVVATLQAALGGARADTDADRELLDAAGRGDADRVAVAIRAGARIEARDGNGRTALLLAAAADHVDAARLLVHLGADPDALDAQHDTPWLVTGVTGSVAMADVLLAAQPDLTIRNRFGGVSIIPASERGHVDYVRRVVRTGIDVNHVNDLGWTALLEAVILGDGSQPYQEIVRTLLEAGADPSIADRQGVTAAEHAAAKGQREIVALLAA